MPSDPFSSLVRLGERIPRTSPGSWVAPGAQLIGDVDLRSGASVWYAAVVRADGDLIVIGEQSNVQDGCVLHADPGLPVRIGQRVTVGHRAVLHGCCIDDDVLVGMGALILNGAHVHSGSIVAAGAVVPEGTEVPPNSLIAGVPARIRRDTSTEERQMIARNAAEYVVLKAQHVGCS